MADSKEYLRQQAQLIRDEYRKGANTAYRVGSLLLAMIDAGVDIDKIADSFLRKDKADQTSFLLKFLAGAEFGETIDSMLAGKGTLITPDGRIQTDRLEVRQSLTVMDLIVNQLLGMAADFLFTDVGKVKSVVDLGNSTYRIILDKQTDFEYTTLQVDDIVHQIVNTLPTGGTDFYSSWGRVVATNLNDNSVTVVLFPDELVPGGINYPPVAGYNIAHKGNAAVPDTEYNADGKPVMGQNARAQYWELSSKEGRLQFLQNVYSPILKDYNYALTAGLLPDIDVIRNLPVTPGKDIGIVAKYILAEKMWQIDWNGDVASNKIDRGEWSFDVATGDKPYRYIEHERTYPSGSSTYTELEQHTVWHYGCKWGCIVDETTAEPGWNSQGWILLQGDKNYYIDFSSSNGWQFAPSSLDTVITADIRYANRYVTDAVMASVGVEVEWIRDTGDVASDNSWSPTYVDGAKHVIRLTRDDMGPNWMVGYRHVKFTCRIAIPYGDDTITIDNVINV